MFLIWRINVKSVFIRQAHCQLQSLVYELQYNLGALFISLLLPASVFLIARFFAPVKLDKYHHKHLRMKPQRNRWYLRPSLIRLMFLMVLERKNSFLIFFLLSIAEKRMEQQPPPPPPPRGALLKNRSGKKNDRRRWHPFRFGVFVPPLFQFLDLVLVVGTFFTGI